MTATATTTQRYLTDEQIASYRREGHLAIPRLIDAERVEALRRVTDTFVRLPPVPGRSTNRRRVLVGAQPLTDPAANPSTIQRWMNM
jgi:hypothetical protein